MKKEITISGQKVEFKCVGSTPFLYRTIFGRDFFKDLVRLEKSMDESMENIEVDIVYSIAYTFAYENNKEIGELIEWLGTFEDGFPVLEVLAELQDLLKANLQSLHKQRTNKKKVTQ